MQFLINHWSGFIALLAAMVGMVEVGRRIGQRRMRTDANWNNHGVTTIENTLLALLGLLLAFTFSGAWSRFDARRELILQESNAIGTAWLRLDLLPSPARERIQESFRRYTDLRIEDTKSSATRPGPELEAVQRAIWSGAVAEAKAASDGRLGQILLPAVNEMFDVATARYQAVITHPPALIYLMLLANTLLASLLAGYGMADGRERNWLHTLCFAGSLLLAIYTTFDLEYPRSGLIRVENYDELLRSVRASMN